MQDTITTPEHRNIWQDPSAAIHRLRAICTEWDGQVRVLDASRRNHLPTGYVTVAAPEGAADTELADAAGYGTSHYGYTVTRHDDGTATVALWND